MTENDVKKAAQIALAVAAALTAGACGSDDEEGGVAGDAQALVCLGGNDCAGMSECSGGPGGTDCAGMNECKGMGWAYTETEAECTEDGGELKT